MFLVELHLFVVPLVEVVQFELSIVIQDCVKEPQILFTLDLTPGEGAILIIGDHQSHGENQVLWNVCLNTGFDRL